MLFLPYIPAHMRIYNIKEYCAVNSLCDCVYIQLLGQNLSSLFTQIWAVSLKARVTQSALSLPSTSWPASDWHYSDCQFSVLHIGAVSSKAFQNQETCCKMLKFWNVAFQSGSPIQMFLLRHWWLFRQYKTHKERLLGTVFIIVLSTKPFFIAFNPDTKILTDMNQTKEWRWWENSTFSLSKSWLLEGYFTQKRRFIKFTKPILLYLYRYSFICGT